MAYFSESDEKSPPIPEDRDLGLMVYDVFDIRKYSPTGSAAPSISLYHAHMRQGVVTVPPYESAEVLKPEEGTVC